MIQDSGTNQYYHFSGNLNLPWQAFDSLTDHQPTMTWIASEVTVTDDYVEVHFGQKRLRFPREILRRLVGLGMLDGLA